MKVKVLLTLITLAGQTMEHLRNRSNFWHSFPTWDMNIVQDPSSHTAAQASAAPALSSA